MSSPPPTAAAAWRALHRAATDPYRPTGRFGWFFARGKLGRDPVFRGLLERGELPAGARVVDLGCGQALLASLLAAVDAAASAGRWPSAWPAAPTGCNYHGIELMPLDVERAQAALRSLPGSPRVLQGDMCQAPLPACDVVVILDVLHYVDHAAQARLLKRAHESLAAGAPQRDGRPGRLLLRVGDQADTGAFRVSQWVDHIVTLVRGHAAPPTYGRPLSEWTRLLQSLGFRVQSVPMSQGTPFANVLLVADMTQGA